MNVIKKKFDKLKSWFVNELGFSLRFKLLTIFLTVKILPLVLLTAIAWSQIEILGNTLKKIAVEDSTKALNNLAVENAERISTDTAIAIAKFLYARDSDILVLSHAPPSEEFYKSVIKNKRSNIIENGDWRLAPNGDRWVELPKEESPPPPVKIKSSNPENNDLNGFRYRHRETV